MDSTALIALAGQRQRMTNAPSIKGPRPIHNRTLSCDWCGKVPPWLYLPPRHAGVFCRECCADVMSPSATVRDDGGDELEAIQSKLDAYLQSRPETPTFCGRGRGRPRKVREEAPRKRVRVKAPPRVVEPGWKYFRRKDRILIVREKKFAGIRRRVWCCLSDGISIEEALAEGAVAGLPESRMVAVIRKMIVVYRVLVVERVA
jgi:hypothetical protein